MPNSFIVAVHGCLAPDLIGAYFSKLEDNMAKYKELTDVDKAAIIDFYQRGLYSQRELAEIFVTSRAQVRRVVAQYEAQDAQVGAPSDDDVGLFTPSDWDVGHPDLYDDQNDASEFPTWLAVLIMVGCALWVGGIIYFAVY